MNLFSAMLTAFTMVMIFFWNDGCLNLFNTLWNTKESILSFKYEIKHVPIVAASLTCCTVLSIVIRGGKWEASVVPIDIMKWSGKKCSTTSIEDRHLWTDQNISIYRLCVHVYLVNLFKHILFGWLYWVTTYSLTWRQCILVCLVWPFRTGQSMTMSGDDIQICTL
jgi:hypothetical protein